MTSGSSMDHWHPHGLGRHQGPWWSFQEIQSSKWTVPHLAPSSLPRARVIPWLSSMFRSCICICISSRLLHTTPLTLLGKDQFHCWPHPSLISITAITSPVRCFYTDHVLLHFLFVLPLYHIFVHHKGACLWGKVASFFFKSGCLLKQFSDKAKTSLSLLNGQWRVKRLWKEYWESKRKCRVWSPCPRWAW